jgi:hypothetical protein
MDVLAAPEEGQEEAGGNGSGSIQPPPPPPPAPPTPSLRNLKVPQLQSDDSDDGDWEEKGSANKTGSVAKLADSGSNSKQGVADDQGDVQEGQGSEPPNPQSVGSLFRNKAKLKLKSASIVVRESIAMARGGGAALGSNRCISVLDMPGFEDIGINSLEQLVANYADEMLRQLQNQTRYAVSTAFYHDQGIVAYRKPQFLSNDETLDLFDLKAKGIWGTLGETSWMPNRQASSFLNRLKKNLALHPCYEDPPLAKQTTCFVVRHFKSKMRSEPSAYFSFANPTPPSPIIASVSPAPPTHYEVRDFLDKNLEVSQSTLPLLWEAMGGSSVELVAHFFPRPKEKEAVATSTPDAAAATGGVAGGAGKAARKRPKLQRSGDATALGSFQAPDQLRRLFSSFFVDKPVAVQVEGGAASSAGAGDSLSASASKAGASAPADAPGMRLRGRGRVHYVVCMRLMEPVKTKGLGTKIQQLVQETKQEEDDDFAKGEEDDVLGELFPGSPSYQQRKLPVAAAPQPSAEASAGLHPGRDRLPMGSKYLLGQVQGYGLTQGATNRLTTGFFYTARFGTFHKRYSHLPAEAMSSSAVASSLAASGSRRRSVDQSDTRSRTSSVADMHGTKRDPKRSSLTLPTRMRASSVVTASPREPASPSPRVANARKQVSEY